MHRYLVALCAIVGCLALAGPAAAQEPTLDVTVTCNGSSAMFTVSASGLAPNEQFSAFVADAEGDGHITGTGPTTDATGSGWLGFGADIPRGTYTVYAYTGPYQTIGENDPWPGSIFVTQFDPSLATSVVSTQVQVDCGPPEKQECKMGGFEDLGYSNQGRCVSANAPGRQ